jgi:hypothetical protein
MVKLLVAVIALIAAAMVAGIYFGFNPVIPIFLILGFGAYMVGRIGGPQLPEDAASAWGGPGRGPYFRVYFRNKPDDSCGGEDPHEGDGFR